MSANNNVTFVGRIGNTEQLSYLQSGTAVAKFSLAVQRPNRNGQEQEPDWLRCAVYGKSAENFAKYCGKGDLISVNGYLRTFSFESEGRNVKGFSIECNDWQILLSKQNNSGNEHGEDFAEEDQLPF